MSTKRTGKISLQIRPPVYLILVLLSTLMMVSGRDVADALIKEKDGAKFLTDNSIASFSLYKRHYKFFNHCSEKQIEMIGSSVTALGGPDSPNANLILQSAHYNNHFGVHIIGEKSGRFLCFNKKSKLITRFSGASPRCIFEEQFSPDYYTVLKSVFNPDWCVGFNRKGKAILGSQKANHRSRCFYFTKRDHKYLDGLHQTRHYGPKIANPHKLLHLFRERRVRRRKRHNFYEMRR